MSRQDKKERQRLKRKRKQQQLRKQRNTSIFHQLARTTGPTRCYVNADWRASGQASIQVLRDAPGSARVYAAFLVDVWCVGLKDAFGVLNSTTEEFESRLDDAEHRGIEIVPLHTDVARRLVLGGIRFARQNGFRLPRRADRWATVFGPVPQPAAADADLSHFGLPGGKLRYVGSIGDLRRRLIGSLDDFLARADVEFVMDADLSGPQFAGGYDDSADDEYEYEEDEDEDEGLDESALTAAADTPAPPEPLEPDVDGRAFIDAIQRTAEKAYQRIRQWLFENGIEPHPLLRQGVDTALAIAAVDMLIHEADFRGRVPTPEEILARSEDPAALADAILQVRQYVGQYQNPIAFLRAMRLPDHLAPRPPALTEHPTQP